MAHKSQFDFISLVANGLPNFFHHAHVLEVGSLNLNGSVRGHFNNCEYTGIDVAPGPDVDLVCQGQHYNAPAGSFDHVISCEVMEHNPHWRETFANMVRLCRDGGLITMTCATTGRPEHGTTRSQPHDSPLTVGLGWDYYRNLTRSNFSREPGLINEFQFHQFWSNWSSFDLNFIGIKKSRSLPDEVVAAWERTTNAIDQHMQEVNGRKLCRYRALTAQAGGDRLYDLLRTSTRAMDTFTRAMDYAHNHL